MMFITYLEHIASTQEQDVIFGLIRDDFVDFVFDSSHSSDAFVSVHVFGRAFGPSHRHLLEARVEVVDVQDPELEIRGRDGGQGRQAEVDPTPHHHRIFVHFRLM